MKTNILFNIGHILMGIIVGVLVYRFSGEHDFTIGLLSIVMGILTIIMMEVLFHPYNQRKEFNELVKRIDYLADRASDRLLSNADFANALKYGNVRVPSGAVTNVWLDRIWNMHQRYWGVLYTNPKEVTNTSVFQLGLAVMSAKVKVDQADVKRIFLFETEDELKNSEAAMRACMQHHLQVRYLYKEQLRLHPLLQQKVSHLPTLDFTICDATITWLLILDKTRHIQHGELYYDSKMNDEYAEVFRMIWDAAIAI